MVHNGQSRLLFTPGTIIYKTYLQHLQFAIAAFLRTSRHLFFFMIVQLMEPYQCNARLAYQKP
jgi:hypothetical protein